jgi:hypothetical protein
VGITIDPADGFTPLPDLVAFDLCKAYPVPGGKCLLHNTRNGKRTMVKTEVYRSLLICNQFQTLDRHVANIIKYNPGMQGQQADIHKVLQSMLDKGMMVSAKNVCARIKQKSEFTAVQPTAPVVVIITWERPEALERLLKSIVANCDTEQFHRLYVMDDSRRSDNIVQNQALTAKFNKQLKVPLQYFGQDEQQSLLNGLANRLPEHEDAIRFLADQSRWRDHWTSGLARNLALLVSCGHRLVMIDDDSICDVYQPPQAKSNISFSDDPREAAFYANEKDWASQHQPINPDPINRHMQCLGLSFSEALTVLGQNNLQPVGLANATALQISELQPDSRVLMTECGSLGCPGTSKNTWLPDMAPVSLKRMLRSKEITARALGSRMVWSGRKQPHFAPRPNMSQITGFDNREMLPPYLPIMRGEDRLFGFMLDFIFPTAVTLDYPWAIPHLPLPERRWRNKDLDFTPAASYPVFLFEKILEYKSSCQSDSPVDRLSGLSAWFNDIAAATPGNLSAMYRDTCMHGVSIQLQHLSSLLSSAESAPVDWQNYLRNGIRQLNTYLDLVSREDFPIEGIPSSLQGEELIVYWKEVCSGFADALNAWPEIRRVAAEIVAT